MHATPNQNAVGNGKYAKLKVTSIVSVQCVSNVDVVWMRI